MRVPQVSRPVPPVSRPNEEDVEAGDLRARQAHAEAKFHAEAAKHGIAVVGRVVDEHGNVVLSCAMR